MSRKINHYPPPPVKQPKRKIPVLIMVAAMVALLVGGLPYARGFVISNYGIELKPKSIHLLTGVQAFLQNDERWAEDKLGESQYGMGGHGCLVCCIASVMVLNGEDTDPGRLNKALYENGVYTKEGDIVWDKLKVLRFRHEYQNDFSASVIEKLLDEGLLPIVKVKYRGNGAFHWVLVTGSTEDDFFVMDPLNAMKEPVPLKTHGKVYAYRVLIKE